VEVRGCGGVCHYSQLISDRIEPFLTRILCPEERPVTYKQKGRRSACLQVQEKLGRNGSPAM
jgi:hypothetical protein